MVRNPAGSQNLEVALAGSRYRGERSARSDTRVQQLEHAHLRQLPDLTTTTTCRGEVVSDIVVKALRELIPAGATRGELDRGGRTLRWVEAGAGSTTAVLDTASGTPGLTWAPVLPVLAKHSRETAAGPLPEHIGLITDGNRRWARQICRESRIPVSPGPSGSIEVEHQDDISATFRDDKTETSACLRPKTMPSPHVRPG